MNFILLVLFSLTAGDSVSAQENYVYEPKRTYTGQSIWDIRNVPEKEMDIGLWSLILAKEFNPKIDVQKYLAVLDSMAEEIGRMIAGRHYDMVKFEMARMYMFQEGIWNDNSVFQYNLDDPLGEKAETKLLSYYLDTKLGNCVSMPILFLALLERVDPSLPVYGVTAPYHLFIRFRDRQTGDIWNIEPTNGGNPMRNIFVIQSFKVPAEAIRTGGYMRNMTKKEIIGLQMNMLARHERFRNNLDKALKFSNLGIELSPKTILNHVQKAGILMDMKLKIHKAFIISDAPIEKEERDVIEYFQRQSDKAIKTAYGLGWEGEDKSWMKEYLKTIEEERQKRVQATVKEKTNIKVIN